MTQNSIGEKYVCFSGGVVFSLLVRISSIIVVFVIQAPRGPRWTSVVLFRCVKYSTAAYCPLSEARHF